MKNRLAPQPRKIFVLLPDDMRAVAEHYLKRLATITAIIPPAVGGYAYRYELENSEWPTGDFNQASLVLNEFKEGMSVTVKAELVMA